MTAKHFTETSISTSTTISTPTTTSTMTTNVVKFYSTDQSDQNRTECQQQSTTSFSNNVPMETISNVLTSSSNERHVALTTSSATTETSSVHSTTIVESYNCNSKRPGGILHCKFESQTLFLRSVSRTGGGGGHRGCGFKYIYFWLLISNKKWNWIFKCGSR